MMEKVVRKIVATLISCCLVVLLLISSNLFAAETHAKRVIWGFSRGAAALTPWDYPGTAPEHQLLQFSLFQNLVRFRPNTVEVEPNFAKSWEVSPDGKVYTFHLRNDIFCSDDWGKLGAKDVVFTFEMLMDPSKKALLSGSLRGIVQKVEAVGEYDVKVYLERPMATFLETQVASPQLGIACKAAVDELGLEEYSKKPVGAGPYKIVSWERNGNITMKANEKFFRGKPQVEDFGLVVIPDEMVTALSLVRDEINFMIVRTPQTIKLLSRVLSVTVIRDLDRPDSVLWLHLNTKRAPLNDLRVRQALMYALDRRTMSKNLEGEIASSVAHSVGIPPLFGYTDRVARYDYNPQKAKDLLVAAGVAPGTKINIPVLNTGNYARVMEAVQSQWAQVGINANLILVDRGGWLQKATSGDYDVFVWNHTDYDMDNNLYSTFHSSNQPPRLWDLSYYSGVDAWLDAQRTETNPTNRKVLLEQIQRKIAEDVPAIPMWYTVDVTASKSYVEGNVANVGTWVVWPELYRIK